MFFPESRGEMTCYSSLQDDDVSFFFIFSCKFYSTHKQTHFERPRVSRESYLHPPWFNLDTFDLEQRSVSTITFEQDAAVRVYRAQGVSALARKLRS